MIDREKVIAGITMLVDRKNDDTCEGLKCCKIAEDALALLKDDETQLQYRDDHIAMYQAEIKRLEALLKEQEPKTGRWIDSAGDDKCSVCGATYSDLYPDYQHTHYCPNCGAKMIGQEVKWEMRSLCNIGREGFPIVYAR